MLKQAWRSYIASLHPRNYKKLKDGALGGIFMYWLVINPIMLGYEDAEDTIQQILFYLVYLLPLLMMWWSNLEQRLPMPKLMYLLPMQRSEQQEYIKTLMLIKIGFPTLVGLIMQILYSIFYKMDLLRVPACTTALASFGIGMYVCSSLRSKFDRYIRYAVRGKDGTGKDAWLNGICMVCSIIYYLSVPMIELEGAKGDAFLITAIWCFIPLAILIIMDVAIIKTRYHAAIIDTCNYEEAFNVLSKVKTNNT